MVGYQDPKMGNNRRQALAQYLKGQSQSRASSANKLRGINTSALRGSRGAGSGTPFQRGGGKASPEKFAFAGMKPSLKTLLGLVGRTMGTGGVAPFSLYGPDTPVGGLEWGGAISPNPSQAGGPPFSMGGDQMQLPSSSSGGEYLSTPPSFDQFVNTFYGNPQTSWGYNGGGDFSGIDALLGSGPYGTPMIPGSPPILGDLLYGGYQGGF